MKIRVLFFAQLRDRFGAGERLYEYGEGAQVADVLKDLGLEAHKELRCAVNETFANGQYPLSDRDVLALLPPVSGG